MKKTKVIAMYLPQFHCIPENDAFWGKGFTDWVTVKNAKPLFDGHCQPKVPLDNNYYDLSLKENIFWQSETARKYGIYGFGIYHYWFNNEKNILTKPAEIIRDNNDINTNYFLAWDNISWKRSWGNVMANDWAPLMDQKLKQKGPVMLIKYELGTEKDWENHYNYLRTHFLSDKYIKIEKKPVFIIYHYTESIDKMCNYWNLLAQKDGFSGIHFIFRNDEKGKIFRTKLLPEQYYTFNYEPARNGWSDSTTFIKIKNIIKRRILRIDSSNKLKTFSYDKIWSKLLKNAKSKYADSHIYHGAFVAYDDTPRRGLRGTIVTGSTPDKFKNYMSELLKISEQQNKDFIFLTAWNEWGEGAYLEPDKDYKFSYLDSLNEAINS